ncbi:MAG TPA: fructosamine kinase family protein [Burkholderiales bacterium]|jgi:fructosamine-3-kinase|nr:fructosamine kinase family protein [Burkholderiales bacterium]
MSPSLIAALEGAIGNATGTAFRVAGASPVGGGCIHESVALEGADELRYFAKLNDARFGASFEAEADGLIALAGSGMRVPKPVAQGAAEGRAFLVLEFLALGAGSDAAHRELGRRLARQHGHRGAHFGWSRDNFIGLTPQPNAPCASWAEFWQTRRLGPQLAAARANGHDGRLQSLGAHVLEAVPHLLAGHAPAPALLHGDLWSGNAAFLRNGTPVVFDPAVYYGDPEADLAMTELFGGFPESFYEGYREVRAIAAGYRLRRILYNLYHILNHLNLFGAGYRSQAERMMERLLEALG